MVLKKNWSDISRLFTSVSHPKSPGTSKSEVLAERTLKGPIAEKLYVNVEFLRSNVGIFLIIMDHEV